MLRRRKFFQGRRIRGADVQDIAWLDASGREMTDEVWNSPDVRCLGVRLNGDAIDELDERGERDRRRHAADPVQRRQGRHLVRAAGDRARRALGDADRHRRSLAASRNGCAPATGISCRLDRWRCCGSTAGRKTCGDPRTGDRWGCTKPCHVHVQRCYGATCSTCDVPRAVRRATCCVRRARARGRRTWHVARGTLHVARCT